MRIIKIDKALYQADDKARAYWFLKRNLNWRNLGKGENKKNKKSLSGYKRIFRNKKIKTFKI